MKRALKNRTQLKSTSSKKTKKPIPGLGLKSAEVIEFVIESIHKIIPKSYWEFMDEIGHGYTLFYSNIDNPTQEKPGKFVSIACYDNGKIIAGSAKKDKEVKFRTSEFINLGAEIKKYTET